MNNKKNAIKKQRILDAAIKVFSSKGFKDASVREIATTAGLTTGSIYYHYRNKNELLFDAINSKIHFVHGLSEKDGTSVKSSDIVLQEIQNQVIDRLGKLDEQKLHILLMGDIISGNGEMLDRMKANYHEIIEKVASMYFYSFNVENDKYKKQIASIFVAALDGMAIQFSMGICEEERQKAIEVFVEFFTEAIPAYLNKHK